MTGAPHHRGPHEEDARLFASDTWPVLREAAHDLAWLLTRGYTMSAALTLVGNRFQLRDRQRTALMRSVCSDDAAASRACRRLDDASGRDVHIDGFNLIMTIEAALAHGTLLLGRDGCVRNLAPLFGTYHQVEETRAALERIGQALLDHGVAHAYWLLDAPVSNSGRLKTAMRELAQARGWAWEIELADNVDGRLKVEPGVVVTSDGVILDACGPWLNLGRAIIDHITPSELIAFA